MASLRSWLNRLVGRKALWRCGPGWARRPSAELVALRCGLEQLRLERDAACDALAARDAQVQALADHVEILRRLRGEREQQLRHALAFRDEFLSIAAHELRTPLTALNLDLQGVARRCERGASRQGGLGPKLFRLLDHVGRLRRLVEGLLDVSRVEGHLALQRENLRLAPLIRDAMDRHRPMLEAARCELRLALDERVAGYWDPLRLEQVLTNLLSNAVKYGPDHPIEIWLDLQGRMARIRIVDHGMGIGSADLERIFARYERAVSVRHYGGLGLGLYIARQIVECHGGEIRARSEPGNGAEFTVLLPLASETSAPTDGVGCEAPPA